MVGAEAEADGLADGDEDGDCDGDALAEALADADAEAEALGEPVGPPEPLSTKVSSERAGMVAVNAPPLTGIAVCAAASVLALVSTGVAVPDAMVEPVSEKFSVSEAELSALRATTAMVPFGLRNAVSETLPSLVVAPMRTAPGWM